jgi:hypothetical protein
MVMAVTALSATAQTWAAAADGTWSNPSSWNPASVPGISATATFSLTGTNYTASVDGATSVGILRLLSANATVGGPGPLTVNGNLLLNSGTLSGLTVNTHDIQLDNLGSQNFLNNATVNIAGNDGLGWTMQSSLIGQGASRVTVMSGATLPIHASTTSSNPAGTATLGTAGGGTLRFDNNGTVALGLGTFELWTLNIGNGVTFNNSGTLTTQRARVAVSAGGILNNSGSLTISPAPNPGNLDQASALTNAGTITALGGTFSVPDLATLDDFSSGLLSGGGTWRAVNAGFDFGTRAISSLAAGTTVELNGAASFAALNSLVQNSGTLRILGGAAFVPTAGTVNTNGTIEVGAGSNFGKRITVQSGGILTGSGTIDGAVTVQSGGRLSPGNGVGTLTVNAPVVVNGGTGTTWDVSFTGVPTNTPATASSLASRITVTGTSTLNLVTTSSNKITLNLIPAGGSIPFGQPVNYVIATATTGSNFQSNGGTFTYDPSQFTVTTSGFTGVTNLSLIIVDNNLVLQFVPVPEPGTVAGVIGLVAAVGLMRRRRVVAG